MYVAAQDGRSYSAFARICERRTLAEVKALMPPPETLEAALKRVKKAVRIGPFSVRPAELVPPALRVRCSCSRI